MFAKAHNTLSSLLSRTGSVVAIVVAAFALVGAVPAFAADNNGPAGKPGQCPVEDANGNVSYVSEGTRVGLFVCGHDGNWHFGWLITGARASSTTLTPVSSAPAVKAI